MTPALASPGVQDSRRSCAELKAAIDAAESVDECMRLSKIAQALSLDMLECGDLARARAEQLNGVQHADGWK